MTPGVVRPPELPEREPLDDEDRKLVKRLAKACRTLERFFVSRRIINVNGGNLATAPRRRARKKKKR